MTDRSSLAREIKKRLPFESPQEELLLNLLRTHALLAAKMDALLKRFKLSEPKYNVLRILRGVSQNPDSGQRRLPSLEIAARMITRVPDITRLVDGLVRDGYAQRVRCTVDRRVVYVGITARGKRKVDSIDAPITALQDEVFESLGTRDIERLNALLDKTRDGLRRGTAAAIDSPPRNAHREYCPAGVSTMPAVDSPCLSIDAELESPKRRKIKRGVDCEG